MDATTPMLTRPLQSTTEAITMQGRIKVRISGVAGILGDDSKIRGIFRKAS